VEVPIAPEKFNWAEYHLFVARSEGAQINAYTEETEKAFENIEAFKETINSSADSKPILVVFKERSTVSILHNIRILKGGETVVGIQGP